MMTLCFVTHAILPITFLLPSFLLQHGSRVKRRPLNYGISKTQYSYTVIIYQWHKPDYGFNRKKYFPKFPPYFYLKDHSVISIAQNFFVYIKGIKQ